MAKRQKEFSVEHALDAALDLFWSRGYEAVSLRNLVERMKISRQSLYDTFGDKRRLFLATLDRYRLVDVGALPAELEQPGAGMEAIDAYFTKLVELLAREPRRGCFFNNAVTEVAPHDPAVAARVRGHLRRLERGFLTALETTAARNGWRPPADLGVLARFLTSSAQGLCVMARSGASRPELQQIATVTLATLRE